MSAGELRGDVAAVDEVGEAVGVEAQGGAAGLELPGEREEHVEPQRGLAVAAEDDLAVALGPGLGDGARAARRCRDRGPA